MQNISNFPKRHPFFFPAGQVATAGKQDALLFASLATAAKQRMTVFKPQNLANTAWAFALVG